MEKEGLHRVLQFLNQENVNIGALVTDRHRQINKWLNDNHPSIVHYYDTWHVAKSKEHFLYCILHDLFPIMFKIKTSRFEKKTGSCFKEKNL